MECRVIKVNRGTAPGKLQSNSTKWTAAYLTALRIKAGIENAKSKYRDPDIKAALAMDARKKCVYCESYIEGTHHSEVDHIDPLSLHPHLLVEWRNLAHSCQKCNHFKSNYDTCSKPFINPYIVDPQPHITFNGPFVTRGNSSPDGKETIDALRLYRMGLYEARLEVYETVTTYLRMRRNANKADQLFIDDTLLKMIQPTKPFSAMVRSTLRRHGWAHQNGTRP
jgi:5-methylcytosine-specific restriction endonuclease McrA